MLLSDEKCFLDANDDDEVDCLTPEGDICAPFDDDLNGYADTCGNQLGVEVEPHQYENTLKVLYPIVSVRMIVKSMEMEMEYPIVLIPMD